jgi:hypothetical protein
MLIPVKTMEMVSMVTIQRTDMDIGVLKKRVWGIIDGS